MNIDEISEKHKHIEYKEKIWKEHSKLIDKGYALEKNGQFKEALEIYFDLIYNHKPIGRTFYKRPAILLEKLKEYEKAIEVCDLVLNNLNNFEKVDQEMAIEEFTKRKERLLKKLSKSATESSNNIIKKNVSSTPNIVNVEDTLSKEIVYPDWYISISFGESKSQSFAQAVALAQMAPQFIINNVEGKKLYQAIYSDKPEEYLQFIKLYELVSNWKSCFVVLNGKVMDRKIIGKLNYCYGDKCRSGKSDFCFGASEMTSNPFGCHRLQVSAYNNPWWSFGYLDTKKIFHIDKQSIENRIMEYSTPYRLCPCFSMDNILTTLNNLPNSINPKLDRSWEYTCNGIQPKDILYVGKMSLDLNINNLNSPLQSTKKTKRSLFSKLISIFEK